MVASPAVLILYQVDDTPSMLLYVPIPEEAMFLRNDPAQQKW